MRTTVELDDAIFRQVKAEAALRGLKFRELVEEGLRRVLEPGAGKTSAPDSLYGRMEDFFGVVDSGIGDLASNPKHLEGFGRDSMGHY